MSISERIGALLERRGYGAQKELSQYIGVTPTTLHNWLKFNRSIPAECIIGISEFLGVSVYYLLTGEEEIKGDFKAIDMTGKPVKMSPPQQELARLRANEALTQRILEVLEQAGRSAD